MKGLPLLSPFLSLPPGSDRSSVCGGPGRGGGGGLGGAGQRDWLPSQVLASTRERAAPPGLGLVKGSGSQGKRTIPLKRSRASDPPCPLTRPRR